MELIVRGSRYFTVGDHGAQFFPVRKGDIIFNAEQTKELFEKGKVTSGGGRGNALAEGTAYRQIKGYEINGGTGSGSGKLPKPSGGGNSKKPSGGGGSSKKEEEDEKEKIDWIEVLLDRIERAIDRLARIADSAFKKLGIRLSATADEIAKVTQEISYQQQGSARYLQEAESVELDESIKQLVRDGKIDINEYDKDTAELISEYQEWYFQCHLAQGCALRILSNCWEARELHRPQRRIETPRRDGREWCVIAYSRRVISSEAANSGTFNDYPGWE